MLKQKFCIDCFTGFRRPWIASKTGSSGFVTDSLSCPGRARAHPRIKCLEHIKCFLHSCLLGLSASHPFFFLVLTCFSLILQGSSSTTWPAGCRRTTRLGSTTRRGQFGLTPAPTPRCGSNPMTVPSLSTAHTGSLQSWEPNYPADHRPTTPRSTCTAESPRTSAMTAPFSDSLL